ncbi:Methyltransferase domain-containing protein [Catalinimonas alkaloidigena]|uniref:Methyltransferase domain-containing protein n=1 Tax=Catalinimonas alkaloidigena TaxID=1075417 RepID=A0A1G8X7E6_9BACT|nr:class I SAM-dependent methyltransferase [Catalinimonas alkaloidigena]SDJ86371.1 Methyltransferase domain-containing protein [Catalinimonas alkaloidigena]
MQPAQLRAVLGDIEPFWLQVLLQEQVRPGLRVLDAGCGMGRNLWYPLRIGVLMYGIDTSAEDIAFVQRQAGALGTPTDHFSVASVAALPFPDRFFDAVLCCDVLHFAEDEAHFCRMVGELHRVLRPEGIAYTRLFTHVGLATSAPQHAPFQADEALLHELTQQQRLTLLAPVHTLLSPGVRSQTYWHWRK